LTPRITAQSTYYIRLDTSVAGIESDYGWLLDAVRTQVNCETIVLYQVHGETSSVKAVAARSGIAARVKDVGVRLEKAANDWIEALSGPVQGIPDSEPNFKTLPEVLQYELKRLLIAPLRTERHLLGLLTLGKSVETGFDLPMIEVAQQVARLLTAVLERDFLQRQLLERKLVERAKGVLQQRRGLSEEQAYFLIRDSSRQRGIPMVEVAKEIIGTYVQPRGRFNPGVWRQKI
jgi:GAF domain-containing protein